MAEFIKNPPREPWRPTFGDIVTVFALVVAIVMWFAPPNWEIGIPVIIVSIAVAAFTALRHPSRALIRGSIAVFIIAVLLLVAWRPIWESFHKDHPEIAFRWPISVGDLDRPQSPSIPPIQGYTQAQLDDAKAKAKQDQLDQDKKDAAQQSADAVAKAIALLRAQVVQLQSDTPVSIDKLPTFLTLSFKGGTVEQIGNAPNVVWTKMFGWQRSLALFGTGEIPSWVIVIVFKKPIAYKTLCFEGHRSGISTPVAEKNPYYAIVTFDPGPLDGLVDLRAANECPK